MSKFFTTDQAASYLGVSTSRVRQLISEGRIVSEKIGRDHMVKEDSLEYFVQTGRKRPGRPKKADK
jgi:site-specific DNA-methyltransferase (cytosine-N4-specific)